jgi:hypothetical protein
MATAEEVLLKEMTDRVSACYVDAADGKLDCGEVLMIAVSYFGKVKAKTLSEKKDLLVKLVSAALEKAVPAGQYERVGSKFVLDVLPAVLSIAAPLAANSWFSWILPSLSCFSGKAGKAGKAGKPGKPLSEEPVPLKPSAVKVVAVKRSSRAAVPVPAAPAAAANDIVCVVESAHMSAPPPSPDVAAVEPPLPNSVDEKSPLV